MSVDPRAKPAMWRVRRALRFFQRGRWSVGRATAELLAEGLTPNVIGQELARREEARKRAKTLAKWAAQRRREARKARLS